MKKFLLWILAVYVCSLVLRTDGALEDSLSYYETLHHVNIQHHIEKRSVDDSGLRYEREITINTLGKSFHMQLITDPALFTPDFQAYTEDNNNKKSDVTFDQTNFYTGYLEDDQSAMVSAFWEGDNIFAKIKTSQDIYAIEPSWPHLPQSDKYSMISYKLSDLKMKSGTSHAYCGLVHADHNDTGYDVIMDKNLYVLPEVTHTVRVKRATSKTSCPMTIVADYSFYHLVGINNPVYAINYMIGTISDVNTIFASTDFNFDGSPDGLKMSIKAVVVKNTTTPDDFTAAKSWGTQDLLNAFGVPDWSASCLAHLFTANTFSDGVLGLAWVASPQAGTLGGICSSRSGGISYNTGWSTAMDAGGKRLPSLQNSLVTTHEIGHGWGSPHDMTADCSPTKGGKYIMYPYSVSGYDQNNNKFSTCSRRTIYSVLSIKKDSCFIDPSVPVCGNGVVEGSEVCDAGPSGDLCCSAKCMLNRNRQCSYANDVCCTKACTYAPTTQLCQQAGDSKYNCKKDQYCSGSTKTCPVAANVADGTQCGDNGQCYGGTCRTYCAARGLVDCQCQDVSLSCYFCCYDTSSQSCKVYPNITQKVALPAMRSCIGGYCDSTGHCQSSGVQQNSFRQWFIITDFTSNNILLFMRRNIVLAVVVLSLIGYLPFVIIIIIVDCVRKRDIEKDRVFHNPLSEDHVRPGSTAKIVTALPQLRQRGRESKYGYSEIRD